jgi:hypothetical protein
VEKVLPCLSGYHEEELDVEMSSMLSRECTGYASDVHLLCRTKTTCFGEPNMCSVAVSVAAEQTQLERGYGSSSCSVVLRTDDARNLLGKFSSYSALEGGLVFPTTRSSCSLFFDDSKRSQFGRVMPMWRRCCQVYQGIMKKSWTWR